MICRFLNRFVVNRYTEGIDKKETSCNQWRSVRDRSRQIFVPFRSRFSLYIHSLLFSLFMAYTNDLYTVIIGLVQLRLSVKTINEKTQFAWRRRWNNFRHSRGNDHRLHLSEPRHVHKFSHMDYKRKDRRRINRSTIILVLFLFYFLFLRIPA